ncbi:MAG: DUF4342 domain-containing protein [Rhodobacteraceae bacterium]|nr:DUF4342 domain-containing protein [Paracoccaceae bacterium]
MTDRPETPPPEDTPRRTFTEVIEVTGGQLIEKVKDLIHHGNVRTLRLRAGDDFTLEMPVTVGAIAGGVVVLAAPWLAVIGVIAAMVSKVHIEVERDADAAAKKPDDAEDGA